MKNLLEKALASAAAAAMVFGLGTVNVVNAETTKEVGNIADLKSAINNAANGDVIKLNNAITTAETVTIPVGKTITLDLNGFTLSKGTEDQPLLLNGGTLTIQDTSANKSGLLSTEKNYTICNHGVMTINGGKFTTTDNNSSLIDNGYYDFNSQYTNATTKTGIEKPELTIVDGTFENGRNAVKNDDNGKLTIKGGTFSNSIQVPIMNWNEAEINGGTFNAEKLSDGSAICNGRYGSGSTDTGKLTITGGTFNAEYVIESDRSGQNNSNAVTNITGGNFNNSKGVLKNASESNSIKLTVSGGTYVSAPENGIVDPNAPAATVKNNGTTTYAIGQNAIASAAATEGNEVTVTKGSVTLTSPKATVKNDANNTTGTVTVDNTTVKPGAQYEKPTTPSKDPGKEPENPSKPAAGTEPGGNSGKSTTPSPSADAGKDSGNKVPSTPAEPTKRPVPTESAEPSVKPTASSETKPESTAPVKTNSETKKTVKSESKPAEKKTAVPAKRAVTDTSVQ